ncbi:hypothetical protein PR048_031392 [Dryococelus australis]|uniref:Uncharacterized protein n=1 Tax=Dryococelus australis TaxID=614101 RepID=A0ABQ9G549_9NEOP|nr:hypothetical protein PR048_031392 [Dryococelus australis]
MKITNRIQIVYQRELVLTVWDREIACHNVITFEEHKSNSVFCKQLQEARVEDKPEKPASITRTRAHSFWEAAVALVVRLLASHLGEHRVRLPVGSPPDYRMWESWRTIPLVGGLSRGTSLRRITVGFGIRCIQVNRRSLDSHASQSYYLAALAVVWQHRVSKREPACNCLQPVLGSVLPRGLVEVEATHSQLVECVLASPVWLPHFLTLDAQLHSPLKVDSLPSIASVSRPSARRSLVTPKFRRTERIDGRRIVVSRFQLTDEENRRMTRGFPHSGIVPDDAAGRRGFSSPPPPLNSGAAPYSPRFTLIDSQDLGVKSRPNLSTHSPPTLLRQKCRTYRSLSLLDLGRAAPSLSSVTCDAGELLTHCRLANGRAREKFAVSPAILGFRRPVFFPLTRNRGSPSRERNEPSAGVPCVHGHTPLRAKLDRRRLRGVRRRQDDVHRRRLRGVRRRRRRKDDVLAAESPVRDRRGRRVRRARVCQLPGSQSPGPNIAAAVEWTT